MKGVYCIMKESRVWSSRRKKGGGGGGGVGRRREEGEETGGGGRPGPAVTCVEGGRQEGARTLLLQLLVTPVKYFSHL